MRDRFIVYNLQHETYVPSSDDTVLLVEVKYGEDDICSLEISKGDTVQTLKELAIGEFEMALLQDSNSYRLFKNGNRLDIYAFLF